jgi:hypothetical protein
VILLECVLVCASKASWPALCTENDGCILRAIDYMNSMVD